MCHVRFKVLKLVVMQTKNTQSWRGARFCFVSDIISSFINEFVCITIEAEAVITHFDNNAYRYYKSMHFCNISLLEQVKKRSAV